LHILPDLVRLEAKYPGILVVLGVHSPKFPYEKLSSTIRKAILRYHVDHPVVNDANLVMWRRYGVLGWPTFVLIDPEGRFYGKVSGEGLYNLLDFHIGKMVQEFGAAGKLVKTPLKFELERERVQAPLYFPGKLLADSASNRLFIADSSNNRIVITDLAGKKVAVAGTGQEGKLDGSFSQATFADPQGLAYDGKRLLYVADRKSHALRALDLKAQTVKTIAGTGFQDRTLMPKYGARPALRAGLNSPWGLLLHKSTLFIGMAGHHQIWAMNLDKNTIGPFAGDGDENLLDNRLPFAKFAQPSGLGSDGTNLFVADSEVSGVRAFKINGTGPVQTIAGAGLFEYGDVNGRGPEVRLQHALDVVHHKGQLYVADTYNNKIKQIDPVRRTCVTYVGNEPKSFDEPSGLTFAGEKLYVADTGSHRIRVVDPATRVVTTLTLQGVDPVPRPVSGSASSK
jgi:hypothetical protein